MLARWWQALLYNPGGFKVELHQLRLSPVATATLVAIMLVTAVNLPVYRLWVFMFLIPIVVCGFALVHGVFGIRGLAKGWLLAFYLMWLFVAWVKLALVLLAVIDSWVDFRKRLPAAPPDDKGD